MLKKINKRAQELSVGTLILIVLGIVVLVILIFGFSMGWENLWKKINIFGGKASVTDVVTACRLAYSSSDKYTLCEKKWKIQGDNNEITIDCKNETVLAGLGKTVEDFGCPQK